MKHFIQISRNLNLFLYLRAQKNEISILLVYIGLPRGKVNILDGHSIGDSKQKSVNMYMYPIPNAFLDTAISLYSSKAVDKKEILRTVSNTGICCSSDRIGKEFLMTSQVMLLRLLN
jgi:hypothetical protein